MSKRGTNQNIDKRSNDDGPVTSQVRIGDEGTEERQQRRRPRPRVDVLRRRRRRLPQWPRQVGYQVRRYPIIRKPLGNLHAWQSLAHGIKRHELDRHPRGVITLPCESGRQNLSPLTDDEERRSPPPGAGSPSWTTLVVHGPAHDVAAQERAVSIRRTRAGRIGWAHLGCFSREGACYLCSCSVRPRLRPGPERLSFFIRVLGTLFIDGVAIVRLLLHV